MGNTLGYAYVGSQTSWGTFSAHALMLPYLEQTPVYNSCNFNWNIWYGTGARHNATVWNTKVNAFLCPSDALAGKTSLNSYYGSFGTGTQPWSTDTNGIFAPEQNAYPIAAVTDGTSNTIAFVEGLVGDFNQLRTPWRQYVSGVPGSGGIQLYDARQNLPGIMALAQQCMLAIQTNPGSNNDRGYRWQTGSRDEPDQHHPHAEFAAVPILGLPVGLLRGLRSGLWPPVRTQQPSPGRRERGVCRRFGPFRQELRLATDLDGAGRRTAARSFHPIATDRQLLPDRWFARSLSGKPVRK